MKRKSFKLSVQDLYFKAFPFKVLTKGKVQCTEKLTGKGKAVAFKLGSRFLKIISMLHFPGNCILAVMPNVFLRIEIYSAYLNNEELNG